MKKLIAIICAALIVSTAVISVNAEGADESDGAGESVQWGDSVTVGAFTISAISGEVLGENDYSYDGSSKELTIKSSATIKISTPDNDADNPATDKIVVDSPDGANITLENVNIEFDSFSGGCAFYIAGTTGDVTVTLKGKNTLTSGDVYAGLQNNSVPLIIQGDGELIAMGGSNGGAGIGGGSGEAGKNIKICGNVTVTAYGGISMTYYVPDSGTGDGEGTIVPGSGGGAGIGGGSGEDGENIKICGYANVTATGGYSNTDYKGAGIGGGSSSENNKAGDGSNITINGNVTVTAQGATGIGGGSAGGSGIIGGSGTNIKIGKREDTDEDFSGTVTAESTTSYYGAGIGGAGGYSGGGDGTDITISGSGTVIAYGDNEGAGIGGGGSKDNKGGNGSNITISGDVTVTAISNKRGGAGGAGIGGGGSTNGKGGDGSYITIDCTTTEDGEYKIKAISGGGGGAGIGGGAGGGNGSNIKIYGGNIKAEGGSGGGGAGIGGGWARADNGGNGSDITISGGKIHASSGVGAGIGGGHGGMFFYTNAGGCNGIIITGGEITAISDRGGAAIGGGYLGAAKGIDISGGRIFATGTNAGIGGGAGTTGDIGIEISKNAYIEAKSNGAGIGGGSSQNTVKITITSGTVIAEGSSIGIGSSSSNSSVTITGGEKIEAKATGGSGSGINSTTVTIEGNNTTVEATGSGSGAGITGSEIKINDVKKIIATGGDNGGAGIGGGAGEDSGRITISGSGTVIAKGGAGGAGIGGGVGGDGTGITISGSGTVEATGGSGGAGIGGGSNGGNGANITIDCETIDGDYKIIATGSQGAGIGGGMYGNGSNITITGGNIKATTNGGYGAGIGGGQSKSSGNGNGSNITITGGKVFASGGDGAGIGGGGGAGTDAGGTGNGIIITGGEIIVQGTNGGAGIGGGAFGTANDIKISGGKIIATSTSGGTGIGGGGNGKGTNIIISGSAYVEAESQGDTGIGGGQNASGSTVTIESGTVIATGKNAGIGGSAGSIITITGGTVTAKESSVGIGSFSGSTVTITGGTVTATGDYIGIGSASGSTVTIKSGTVTATGTNIAGIGGSDSSNNSVYINGTSSNSFPWVFTNKINRTNNDAFSECIVFDEAHKDTYTDVVGNTGNTYAPDGVVYGEVDLSALTEAYTLESGKLLRVHTGAIFKTKNETENKNKLILQGTLYLEAGATLDKYTKIDIDGGEILHEKKSDYIMNRSGEWICDICGKKHEYSWPEEWEDVDDNIHRRTCIQPDCSVFRIEFDCGETEEGEHDYDFDNPTDDNPKVENGKLIYHCKLCGHVYTVDIPIIYLTKVDGETKESLAGAEFGLYSDAECTDANRIATGTAEIDTDDASDTYNKAVVSFDAEQLSKTYYIKEIKAPADYKVSDVVYKAVVDADGKVTYGTVGSETTSENIHVCKNYKNAVQIIKVDGETGDSLAGAVFGLYSDAECKNLIENMTGTTKIDNDNTSDTYNKAVVSFAIELNKTYYIKEINAPAGYEISDEVYKAVVDADGKVTYGTVGSETTSKTVPVCKNYAVEVVIISGTAKIIKEDGETNAPLAGAEFGLYSDAECTDDNRIATGTTKIDTDSASDTYNKAVVSFVTEPNKTYYIKETNAPAGYEISDKVYKAVVDTDGKVTYGTVGSETTLKTVPVCKNKKTADADTSVPEDTPTDEARDPETAHKPEITRSPETGDMGMFGTAGIALLSGIAYAASLVMGGIQKRKRKNSDDDVADL